MRYRGGGVRLIRTDPGGGKSMRYRGGGVRPIRTDPWGGGSIRIQGEKGLNLLEHMGGRIHGGVDLLE